MGRWICLIELGVIAGILVSPHAISDFEVLYAGARAWRAGGSPYIPGFYSPIWLAVLLAPLTVLRLEAAYLIAVISMIAGYGLALWNVARRWDLIAIALACPLAILSWALGNVDTWVVAGAFLPPAIGIWLVMLKPQMGSIVALLFVWRAWRRNGWKSAAALGAPVAAALGLSVAAGMRWAGAPALAWSADAWPGGFMIGLPLAVLALQRGSIVEALAAGPLCAPYLAPMGWIAILPACLHDRRLISAALIASWVVYGVWLVGGQK